MRGVLQFYLRKTQVILPGPEAMIRCPENFKFNVWLRYCAISVSVGEIG
jgi:hypothetical protein